MSVGVIVVVCLIIFATHLAGAVAAYGSSLLALPLLVLVIADLDTAVYTLMIVGTVQVYHIVFYTYKDVVWREVRRVVIAAGVGLPFGYLLRERLPQAPLMVFLGAVLIAAGASSLLRRQMLNPKRPPEWALNALLLAGGVIHGAFLTGGVCLVLYARFAFDRKETFRATLCMIWLIMNTGLVLVTICLGNFTAPVVRLSAIALPFLFAGNWLGQRVAVRIRQKRFLQFVCVMLVISGLVMIGRVLAS